MPAPLAHGPSGGTRAAGEMPAARSRLAPSVNPVTGDLDELASAELLSDLGFLLVPGRPFDDGRAYLLVALRPRPTRAHFDPERVEFWASGAMNGDLVELDWATGTPTYVPDRGATYRWGPIVIADRVPVVNRFVSFGGSITVSRRTGTRVIVFASDAPILTLGGHSGPADPLAASMCGFFARLRAAAGSDGEIGRVAQLASPIGLYVAYLQVSLARYANDTAYEVATAGVVSLLRSERARLSCTAPADSHVGRGLAALMESRLGGSQ